MTGGKTNTNCQQQDMARRGCSGLNKLRAIKSLQMNKILRNIKIKFCSSGYLPLLSTFLCFVEDTKNWIWGVKKHRILRWFHIQQKKNLQTVQVIVENRDFTIFEANLTIYEPALLALSVLQWLRNQQNLWCGFFSAGTLFCHPPNRKGKNVRIYKYIKL